ncbi:enoyl-CoA hydratase [Microbacterium sp. APC 3898]|uniref:Enoyl-CoA hydratase n=2 Tax=Planococcus TaxID=1372 RepID=A0ABT7ZNR5_9BACL|nr:MULTISPECIES: enoyl-CoA hydratase [Terrabacteria group]MBD8016447.1 enoyl-CoA hydratase [Planococcus wigleyi]MDN3428702.1 enoyl-CoA hydratase [Planococcus sp. APC 4016]MDN3500177.1 enoyl-CoA hydratase [Microbacterium sp. APC 3898]
MENKHLNVKLQGAVLSLQLNRPDSLNAFSPEMIEGLHREILGAASNPDIRVIILSGAGRSFSAGGDVKTMGQAGSQETYDHIGKLNKVVLAMRSLEKPIIAAVHGFAAGAAFNIALASDIILAAEDSKFVMSFSQVGLISDGGGLYFLPRLIGPYRAKELFFNAQPITAETAHQWGIVNHMHPLEKLEQEAFRFAEKLANGPAKAFGLMKKIADQSATMGLAEILEQERITQAMMITTEDHLEGVSAFKEKRKPVFNGVQSVL